MCFSLWLSSTISTGPTSTGSSLKKKRSEFMWPHFYCSCESCLVQDVFFPEGNVSSCANVACYNLHSFSLQHPPLSFQGNKAEVDRLLELKRKRQEQKPP